MLEIKTHILDVDLKRCARCHVEIPRVIKDGKPIEMKARMRVGLIEGAHLGSTSYVVGQHDANKMCDKAKGEANP